MLMEKIVFWKAAAMVGLMALPIAGRAQSADVAYEETLREVTVNSRSAQKRVDEVQIGVEKVEIATLAKVPSLFGEKDIIKSIQLLPGIKSESEGSGGYQVRGGTAAQNLILLDGATIYNAGHLMGLFSTFNDDALMSGSLYKGLVPAQLGGGSSSVLNMSIRTGDAEKNHFSYSVGLLSAKAEADGPMGKNGSTYLVAARTSYLDVFIKSSGKYKNNSLSFYDLNAKLNFNLSENDQLYFSLFRGYDNIEVEKMMNMAWSNTTASLGWVHSTGIKHLALTQLVASNFDTDQGMDIYSININMKGYNRQLTLRHQQTLNAGRHHSLNVGGETTWIGVQSAEWRVVSNREREKRDGWFSAIWGGDDMSFFNKHLLLSAGLRMEWFSALGGKPYYKLDNKGNIVETSHPGKWKVVKTYPVFQPRLSLTWRIGQYA